MRNGLRPEESEEVFKVVVASQVVETIGPNFRVAAVVRHAVVR